MLATQLKLISVALCVAPGLLFWTGAARSAAHTQGAQIPQPEYVTLLHAGWVLERPGESQPRQKLTLVVHKGRIQRVAEGYLDVEELPEQQQADARVIDLKQHYVLPGLMDSHVHLSSASGAYASPSRRGVRDQNAAQAAVNAVIGARQTLAAGFTTVRDVGSDETSVFAVRDAIAAGKFLGPTILASGPSVSVTGGHWDTSQSADPDERASLGVCDGAAECRRLVRYLHKKGSDLIKFKATGGFSSNTGLGQHMFYEEMEALVSAAHQRGMKITTHAYDPNAIRDAIRAGVDSIEHGYLLDDEGVRMMKKAGTYLVPTLIVAAPPGMVSKWFEPGKTPSELLRDEHRAFERAYAAGVNIAYGTDCGIYPHGRNADEFPRMVELGMSPADAIGTATLATADLYGISQDAGSLDAGKRADVIAVMRNPLDDISALQAVDFVMKSGRVAKRDGQVSRALDWSLKHEY